MADPNDTNGAPPREIHIEDKKTNWLAWIALLLGILALLFALSRCNRDETAAVTPVPTESPTTVAATPAAVVGATADADDSTVLAGTSGLGQYLAGTEPAPRRFTFEKLTFATGGSSIGAGEADELDAIAATLKQYPNSRIRIAGYADSRGPTALNIKLGKTRADSVKAALVERGIAGERIATVSGGEDDPVETNATANGRAENRRTELVVTTR